MVCVACKICFNIVSSLLDSMYGKYFSNASQFLKFSLCSLGCMHKTRASSLHMFVCNDAWVCASQIYRIQNSQQVPFIKMQIIIIKNYSVRGIYTRSVNFTCIKKILLKHPSDNQTFFVTQTILLSFLNMPFQCLKELLPIPTPPQSGRAEHSQTELSKNLGDGILFEVTWGGRSDWFV